MGPSHIVLTKFNYVYEVANLELLRGSFEPFLRTIKDLLKINNSMILGLLEPRISGVQADKRCNSLGFESWIRVEALGFSGGIWLL